MNLYADIILDHWQNPQNYGVLKNYDLVAEEINPLCGDEIRIQLKTKNLKHNTMIEDIRFSGNGCAISKASASILTEYIKGKKLNFIAKLHETDLISLLGIEIGPQRIKCASLPLIALKKALS